MQVKTSKELSDGVARLTIEEADKRLGKLKGWITRKSHDLGELGPWPNPARAWFQRSWEDYVRAESILDEMRAAHAAGATALAILDMDARLFEAVQHSTHALVTSLDCAGVF